jgi:hypothetical protein
MLFAIFQIKMNCSACIQNPIVFLGRSTHRLIRRKNLPTVYDDEFLGNALQ